MPTPHSQRVERYLASHPGATLAEARGHGKTPEHPGQGTDNERFREYYEKRQELEAQIQDKKRQEFSHSTKWREDRSARNLEKNPGRLSDYRVYLADGIAGLQAMEDFDWQDERWAWLRYH
jgi:hypothetical protein